MTPTLDQAMKLADQDCPLPSLAGPALKALRARVLELEGQQAARVDERIAHELRDEAKLHYGSSVADETHDLLLRAATALEAALSAQPAPERQGECGGPCRLHGWKAKRTDCPDINGWVITPPEGCGVLVEDGSNTSGSDMLREIAIRLSAVPPASSACPICGADSPHKHSGEEVAKYRGATTHPAAPVGVPDAIGSDEHGLGYMLGWNCCREATIAMNSAAPSAPQVDA